MAGKRGYSGNTTTLSWRRPGRQNGAISWENDALEGRNKGRRTEKMGRDGRKQEPLTTGKLFSPYYIYSAGVSVSAMQPCSASFNSLPLPREYNITNMTAAKRYESVWNAFLNELSHNPTATLTSFLKRCNVRQGRMKRWMENHGLSVKEAKKRLRDCQHDGIGDPMSPLSEDSGSLFLPMATDKPAPRSESCDILSGVSLTFPDGTQVNIKRGSAQAVMSFLKLYQREDLPCLD